MATSKYITPGTYSTETDLTSYSTTSVGVTTLGLVGETKKGPAFQPIFVSDYDSFSSYFGGLSPEKYKATNRPKYELPYIAKEYLRESNQLYVTRILGLSGYNAGQAWGIAIEAGIDPETTGQTGNGTLNVTFTGATVVIDNEVVETIYGDGFLPELSSLYSSELGTTLNVAGRFDKNTSNGFIGTTIALTIDSLSGNTGSATGTYINYSGTSFSAYEGNVIALVRSRGKYDSSENLVYDVSSQNGVLMIPSSDLSYNPTGSFILSGTSAHIGAFSYEVSMDSVKKNYISKILGKEVLTNKNALFVEELFGNSFTQLVSEGKVWGIKPELVKYNTQFNDYLSQFTNPITPYVVSEVRGTNLFKLFRFVSISDGNSANQEIKISIANIKPDEKQFDVIIRSFSDTDANPVVFESFRKLTMDSTSGDYIAARIGTSDGSFESKSKYIMVEMADELVDDAFPAGFLGYPVRNYALNNNTNIQALDINYKATYSANVKKRKEYLGISDISGFDNDFFNYKGKPLSDSIEWTGLTSGFHLDVDASQCTIDGVKILLSGATYYQPIYSFTTGNAEFKNEDDLADTDYEDINARKFTLVPYGGFDGWDVYRTSRTNTDRYIYNGTKANLGLTSGVFKTYAMNNGDPALTSDYYAYLTAIQTFDSKLSTPMTVIATPGIDAFDHSSLIEETIDMIEDVKERQDLLYIFTTPDVDYYGNLYTESDVTAQIEGSFDSSFAASYWPWGQYQDTENNVLVWLPPTIDVCRNIATTGNNSYLWFAFAGVNRGTVKATYIRKKLKLGESDTLYENRLNPVIYYPTEGIKIWGQKTMQIADTALNRINIRMVLNQAKTIIEKVVKKLVFDPNDDQVRTQFLEIVNPQLEAIKKQRGLTDFRIKIQDSADIRDRLELPATILLKPTRALEYIELNFTITNTGVDFDSL